MDEGHCASVPASHGSASASAQRDCRPRERALHERGLVACWKRQAHYAPNAYHCTLFKLLGLKQLRRPVRCWAGWGEPQCVIIEMKRFLTGCLVGGAAMWVGMENMRKVVPSVGLPAEQHSIVSSYLQHHNLSKLLKQSIMNGYMQLSKSFLDYGLREKMEGFFFYGTYFRKEEIDAGHISHAYCIFSPKEQLCGHPNIQHGGATATIIDQNAGVLAMIHSYELVATSQLNVKYLKTVKKGQTYAWHGQIERREGRKIFVKSTIVELETGVLCVESEALMMTVNWEHKMGDVFHMLFKRKDNLNEVS